MYGAILGDIIGSPYEFDRGDKTKDFPLFGRDAYYTDDSIMTLAVAEAFMYVSEAESDEAIKKKISGSLLKWGRKYPFAGYGTSFLGWLYDDDPKPYGSFGNGSAMRVSYIADFTQTVEGVSKLAKRSAECTHGSKEGILGAVTVAGIIAMANLNRSKKEIVQFVVNNTPYDISTPIEHLRRKYIWNETCSGTVPAAIRCFLDSTDYESCIRNCLSLPCDMDTMCCIAGGMAEAFYGTTGLNNKNILQRYLTPHLYECIKDIVEKD